MTLRVRRHRLRGRQSNAVKGGGLRLLSFYILAKCTTQAGNATANTPPGGSPIFYFAVRRPCMSWRFHFPAVLRQCIHRPIF